MTQVFVATFMWALVASLLIIRRKRADRSITYASVTIAVAMTLNVDAVYLATDPLLGGTNVTTLVADGLLMTGVFFLGRGVMKAGEYRPRLLRAAVGVPVLVISLVSITTTFMFIDRGAPTTQFMIDFGAQPAAATYSIITFTYFGLVVTTMMILAARQYRDSSGIQRLPAGLLSLGSALGGALCLVVLTMDVAHVTGHLDLMRAIQPAYGPLSLLTFLFLCGGFAVQPAVRRAQHSVRRKRATGLATQLEPLWNRASLVRPGLSRTDPLAASEEDPESRLHRQIVEIRDAMVDPRVTFDISAAERTLLERAESHLLGLDTTATQTNASPVSQVDERGRS